MMVPLSLIHIFELVDDEMGDDYAKLGGLTSEEDLNEGVLESVKKRLPWLIALAVFPFIRNISFRMPDNIRSVSVKGCATML